MFRKHYGGHDRQGKYHEQWEVVNVLTDAAPAPTTRAPGETYQPDLDVRQNPGCGVGGLNREQKIERIDAYP